MKKVEVSMTKVLLSLIFGNEFSENKSGFPALPGGRGIIEMFYNTFTKHTNVFFRMQLF